MSTLKKFFLAAAVMALPGCMSSSEQYASDDYYADDFALEAPAKPAPAKADEKPQPKPEKAAPKAAPAPAAKQGGYSQVSEVSKKVEAVNAKLKQIQESIAKNSASFRDLKSKSADEANQYYEYIARIHARLQIGTTPGNPELVEMWKQASAILTGMDKNISETARLATETSRTKNELNTLLDTIRDTYQVPGAMEIDHENLRMLEDDANQTMVTLNRLTDDVAAQISRQQQYYSTERQNINSLESDIQAGRMTGTGYTVSASAAPSSMLSASSLPQADIAGRRPLMVIRFDRRKVAYEQPLYQAVKAALDKRPNTGFELVAVSPAKTVSGEQEAFKNADAVRSTLLTMGLPSNRISMSKMQSASIKTTEVQLFLK